MAITAVYLATRAGSSYERSLDGGATWTFVPGFTTGSSSINDMGASINPYSAKNVQLVRVGPLYSNVTFYSNDAYVTNGESFITSEISNSCRVPVIDKYRSYIADIDSFRLSTNAFASYAYYSLPDTMTFVRFYMSCPYKGVLGVNIDNDPYLYKTGTSGAGWIPINQGGAILQASSNIGGVWCDQNVDVIVAVTQDKVWRSTNGGNTFTSVQDFTYTSVNTYVPVSGGSANCIYFIDGNYDLWKSDNQGQSWTILLNIPHPTPSEPLSISFDRYDTGFVGIGDTVYKIYVSDLGIYVYESVHQAAAAIRTLSTVTYNCGCPEGFTYNASTDQCEKLDPSGKFGNLYADFIKCPYYLENCYDPEDIIYVDGETSVNMDAFVSKVISYNGNCYSVHNYYSLEYNMVTIDASSLTPFETCFECNPLYNLYACNDTETVAYCTDSDLSVPHSAGSIISIAIDGIPQEGCYIIGQNNTGLCDVTTSNITVTTAYTDCTKCLPLSYKLTNCMNPDIYVYIVDNAFSQYKNKSVILEEYPLLCWSVEEVTLVDGPIITGTVKEVYPDCACCKQYSCN